MYKLFCKGINNLITYDGLYLWCMCICVHTCMRTHTHTQITAPPLSYLLQTTLYEHLHRHLVSPSYYRFCVSLMFSKASSILHYLSIVHPSFSLSFHTPSFSRSFYYDFDQEFNSFQCSFTHFILISLMLFSCLCNYFSIYDFILFIFCS